MVVEGGRSERNDSGLANTKVAKARPPAAIRKRKNYAFRAVWKQRKCLQLSWPDYSGIDSARVALLRERGEATKNSLQTPLVTLSRNRPTWRGGRKKRGRSSDTRWCIASVILIAAQKCFLDSNHPLMKLTRPLSLSIIRAILANNMW